MTTRSPSLLAFAAVLLASASTLADVPPPDSEACWKKSVGDACTYGGAGTCQEGTCSKLDYSKWDRDASSSPPSMTYACVKCVPGTITSSSTNTATDTTTGSATNTTTGSATDTATGSATNTTTGSATDTATNTRTEGSTSDDGWCSVTKSPTAGRIGSWLMAAAFSLLFLAGRRRRQK